MISIKQLSHLVENNLARTDGLKPKKDNLLQDEAYEAVKEAI